MRVTLVIAAVVFVAACVAPPIDDDSPKICTPDEVSCMGNALTQCTRSGRDLISVTCPGSGTNPGVCRAGAGCPGGASACCVRQKPICTPAIATLTGADGGAEQIDHACTEVPRSCATAGALTVTVAPATDPLVCDPNGAARTTIRLSIRRPVTLGQSISLPSADVALSTLSIDSSRACDEWTGMTTVLSEVPDWRVVLSVSCTEPGKGELRVAGDLTGAL